jgi:hypothetical protein
VRPSPRWPLHPAPVEGEALSSWLSRIARRYGMALSDLLMFDLGQERLDDLDMAPPAALLDRVARRSGVDLDQLRGMTLSGLVPWLLDRVDPDPDSATFDTYVGQLSVLLPKRGYRSRRVPGWRAWLPKQSLRRACPRCLQDPDKQALLLVWLLPLVVSCPLHGMLAGAVSGSAGPFPPMGDRRGAASPGQRGHRPDGPAYLAGPDQRIRGVAAPSGPYRPVVSPAAYRPGGAEHRPIASSGPGRGHAVDLGALRLPSPGGTPVLASLRDSGLVRTAAPAGAAAVAIRMIETRELAAHGTEAPLFLPEPLQDGVDGWLCRKPAETLDPWQRAAAAAEEVVAQAKRSPKAARELFDVILLGRTDADAIRQVHRLLTEVGVPAEFLSH